MNPEFYTLTIDEVIKETPDCVSISFVIPNSYKTQFEYVSGQYLTFKKSIDGEELRRSYSLCSEPSSGKHKVAIKHVENGKFSNYANTLMKPGDTIECMVPSGNFKHIPEKTNQKNYVLFAAGSGITPIISIVKSILSHEPESRVVLFYGNKGFHSVIFREELESLKNLYLTRLNLIHVFSKENLGNTVQKGRIDKKKCEELYNAFLASIDIHEVYICGPEEMTLGIREMMLEKKIDKKNIHLELFGTSIKKKEQKSKINTASFDSTINLIMDGDEFKFPLNTKDDSILEAAHKIGVDVPFACKGGVCCTCKAKILEGSVHMDVHYGLEQEEIDAGYVLTCQSHPTSDKVTISFDN